MQAKYLYNYVAYSLFAPINKPETVFLSHCFVFYKRNSNRAVWKRMKSNSSSLVNIFALLRGLLGISVSFVFKSNVQTYTPTTCFTHLTKMCVHFFPALFILLRFSYCWDLWLKSINLSNDNDDGYFKETTTLFSSFSCWASCLSVKSSLLYVGTLQKYLG